MTYLSNQRTHRYKRKELTGKLTDRDFSVLLTLYWHRCMTTEQLAEAVFAYNAAGKPNNQRDVIARRRLRKLYDAGLVDRFFVDVGEGAGSSPAHYVLDDAGAKVLAGMMGVPLKGLDWRYEMSAAKVPFLGHIVGINQFYLEVLRESRKHGDTVEEYVVEHHARQSFDYWGSSYVLTPDAYGQYWRGEEGRHFFLEWDTGSMSAKQFATKHQRYTALYDSGEYRKRYNTFPLVLVVTPTPERAAALCETIAKRDKTDVSWWFTHTSVLSQKGFTAPIWSTLSGHMRAIFDRLL